MERTFKEKLSEKLMSFAGIIGKNIYLLSLRDAFMLSFPLTMFGSILLVVTNFPGFSEKAREGLGALMGHSIESSMLLMSIFVSIGIGYYLYLYKNPKRTQDAIYSGAVALVSFFIRLFQSLFGLPVILNPILAIPWILGSPITISIAYFATKIGIMPRTTGVAVPWTMSLGISGTLATNSIMGGVVQIVGFVVMVLLWIPFILYSQKQYEEQKRKNENELKEKE